MTKPQTISLPGLFDAHAHLRQGPVVKPLIKAHLDMGCFGVVAMPNTSPPVTKVHSTDPGNGWSIQAYRDMLLSMGGTAFAEIIVPLYLSADTTPRMIEDGAKSGLLKAVKYYPPHGTTNSGGAIPLEDLLTGAKRDVLHAMAEMGVILCLHGEQHGLGPTRYYGPHGNAETVFYRETAPRIGDAEPELPFVAEHITTSVAANFVLTTPGHIAATITPQHLLYTIGDWALTKSNHAVCMPLLKYEDDRLALLECVLDPNNTKFFAGTDSAPHPESAKAVDCGCAAGCFTGGVALQLYAMAFESAGFAFNELSLRRFMCDLGAAFYNVAVPTRDTIRLVREETPVLPILAPDGQELVSLPRGLVPKAQRDNVTLPWRLERVLG